jgi:hypothetical protein
MPNLFNITEEEKHRILNLHENATNRQYLSEQFSDLGQPTQPEIGPKKFQDTSGTVVKKGLVGDPYVYGKLGDDFYYAKASDGDYPNWILASNANAINSIKSKIYNEKVPVIKTIKAPEKKTAKRQTVKKTNSINKTTNNVPEKNKPKLKDKEITQKVKTKTPKTQPGATSWLRKRFPNIAQLLSGRELKPNDFTENQKKSLLSTIQNSQKRTKNQKSGSTIYSDYGSDVASTFENQKGSPSNWDVIWNSVTNNDRFAMATLFGKFNWVKNSDGSYTIDDKYDFKNPHYENIVGVNRKSLEGKTIQQLRSDYDLGYYEAARVKGWVDYPEEIPGKFIPLKLTINPSELT